MKAKLLHLVDVALLLTLTIVPAFSLAQGTWIQKADFPVDARYSEASFSINSKGYVVLGYKYSDVAMRDFWEWDQATNIWTRKADYPGNSTNGALSFSIGTKGYIGTGGVGGNGGYINGFWEYDPSSDTWTQKASLPGTVGRAHAVGFSIGTKGYIGTGFKYQNGGYESYKDFWEWDQATNVWTQKADFGGSARSDAVGFSIGNKGYIGTGMKYVMDENIAYLLFKDFWEWDQATNVWTQKTDFGGTERFGAIGFSVGNKGYIGIGFKGQVTSLNDFWEWDPEKNIWIQQAHYKGNGTYKAVGFSIENKGYIGLRSGVTYADNGEEIFYSSRDFWEFDPLETTGIVELAEESTAFYPNPAFDIININSNNQNNAESTLTIYSVTGEIVKSELLKQNQQQFNVADLKNGIYMVEVKSNNWTKKQKLLIQR